MPDAVTNCPLCGWESPACAVSRTQIPVHQNLVVDNAEDARKVGRGELRLHLCAHCGFGWNATFDPTLLSYGEAYDNTQNCSPHFDKYTNELAKEVVRTKGGRASRFVEVGCGKGTFLRNVVRTAGPSATGWGFDPSYVGPDDDLEGRVRFVRTFYDTSAAEIQADAVACRHVIEHVPSPLTLLRSVRAALSDSPDARVFFETPCLRWILENQVVWDLFYEHCSLFTAGSLTTAFQSTGFRVERVRHVFGGQYLWLEASLGAEVPAPTPDGLPELGVKYAGHERQLVNRWRNLARTCLDDGPVCVWGAGAKGATLLNLIDPARELVTCVIDINPTKQGGFLPGTGHPIVGPTAVEAKSARTALVLNPNYYEEIRRQAETLLPSLHLVSLMEQR